MVYIHRLIEALLAKTLKRNKSVLLLGPRQTGKSTLIGRLDSDLSISFVRPDVRQRYEKDPSILVPEVEGLKKVSSFDRPLVVLDEVQKVPLILDVVQDLVDRQVANFILTGSSARKLRRGSQTNLLPGRVVVLRLDPFVLKEAAANSLQDLLVYGSLPGIFQTEDRQSKELDLKSYVTTYLEEEIRAEAVVRNLSSFSRFLEFTASESGNVINLSKLSQEVGVAHTTIASYYQILEDCLIAERIEPLTRSRTRKKLTKSQKYLFFDLGIRRAAAGEGLPLAKEILGSLFEQWVGLELLRISRVSGENVKIRFWRDPDGPEVDWIIEKDNTLIPVEVKWTSTPSLADTKHLRTFLNEYPEAKSGYVVCQTPRRMKLQENILAIPWQEVESLIEGQKTSPEGL